MDYFILNQLEPISIPKPQNFPGADPCVCLMENLNPLEKFDYIASEAFVSDRLKQLIEQYLPEQDWQPCFFVDISKKAQKTFWRLPRLPYAPERIASAPNGTPLAIYVKESDFAFKSPGIFRIRSPKGTPYTIVHLSVAESILRRGICGLSLQRLTGNLDSCGAPAHGI